MTEIENPPSSKIKMHSLMIEWENMITAVIALCAVSAIALGLAWLVTKKDTLIFLVMGFSLCYLVGKKFWKYRRDFI